MSYFNGFVRLHLDLALWLSYLDLAKHLEHKARRYSSCWGVEEVENIENTKQI